MLLDKDSLPTTEVNEEKGRAIDIAADKSKSSRTSIRKAQKIINASNLDEEIEEDWKKAKLGKKPKNIKKLTQRKNNFFF